MATHHAHDTEHGPCTAPSTILTDRYTQALAYATALHGTDVRKDTTVTYLCHLIGVSSLVLEAGGTEDQAIAGLLHDAVEDAGGMPRACDIRARFGDAVADMILACSDSTDAAWKAATPYAVRKDLYLKHLEFEASDDAVLVSIADKVHNARAILTDLERTGTAALGKFNSKTEELRNYYSKIERIAKAREVTDALVIPLELAVKGILAHLDGRAEGRPT